jgi:hypothetical protein
LVEKHIYLIVETKELTLSASKQVNTLAMEFASLLKCFLYHITYKIKSNNKSAYEVALPRRNSVSNV